MVGVAYDADFLLAKTEIMGSETQIEEDNWVAGIEWGEYLGADIVTSSLGYNDWYTWEDMDGHTAECTIVAAFAARLGLIVVNAVGNEYHDRPRPTLIAPSDGDSVIAVGAVTSTGEIVNFSSNGPTFDGRIKPDLCALGSDDRVAVHSGGYGKSSGTSFATPLVAGTCALLLQAHPDWHYGDVYHALIGTATKAASPGNIYGYGIVRAYQALNFESDTGRIISGVIAAPNPFTEYVDFIFSLQTSGDAKFRVYDVAGEKVAEKSEFFTFSGEASSVCRRLSWDGRNSKGNQAAAGVYIVYFASPGIETTLKVFKKE
jgi:subtilisin family serine protease